MERSLRAGSSVFAAGMAAFGVLTLVRLDVVPAIEPLPAGTPLRLLWVCLSGALLVSAAGSILLDRRAGTGAKAIALLLSLSILLLHVPGLIRHPLAGGNWVVAFETLALAAAAGTLAILLGSGSPGMRLAARLCFGVSFLAFGGSHFVYHAYVESVIPRWIPGPVFWTYAIGTAHIAAGLSILSGIKARLAATLLAIMFGSWVVIVHSPRVFAARGNFNEWSSLFVALSMCGASWIMSRSVD